MRFGERFFLSYEYATNAAYGWGEICDRHAHLPSTEKIKYFLTFEIEGKMAGFIFG